MLENQVQAGISNHQTGANGLLIQGDCIGNPTLFATEAKTYALNCYLLQRDQSTNFGLVVWKNGQTDTELAPSWTMIATYPPESLTLTVDFSSADILALNSSPKTVIPAVSGKTIVVDEVLFTMTFNTSAYTGANALEHRYTNGSGEKVTADIDSSVLDIASGIQQAIARGVSALIFFADAPVVASVPTANPAAGAGTAVAIYVYRLV